MVGEVDGRPENIKHAAIDVRPNGLFEFIVELFRILVFKVTDLIHTDQSEFLCDSGSDPWNRLQLV